MADATVIVRTADQLEVVEGDIADGELVAVGLPVVLSNNVAQDATIVGNRVTVNGDVGSDLLAVGFFVDVNGSVADDVRVVGGEVDVSGEVAGDVIILGGAVDILSTAKILGDLVVYGGAVTINGEVGGGLVGVMDVLEINGPVGGDVEVDVTQLTLRDKAVIAGTVQYTSHNLVAQSLNASVSGEVVRSDPTTPLESNTTKTLFMMLLVTLFTALVWHLCSPKTLTIVVQRSTAHVLRSAAVGVLAPFVLLLVATILFISQLGMYVAAILLFGLVSLILIAGAGAPAFIGVLLLKTIGYPTPLSPLAIVTGAMVFTLCMAVPVMGVACMLIAVAIVLGAMLEAMFAHNW